MSDSSDKNSPHQDANKSLRDQLVDLSDEVTQLQLQNEALQKLVKNLQVESMTDELTGIHNRRFYDREVASCLACLDGAKNPFCLMLADVDQLKEINDRFGHLVGDQVLQDVAAQLHRSIRNNDKLSRIGGDEFAIVMPTTTLEQGQHAAREVIDSLDLKSLSKKEIQITLSYGVAAAKESDSAISLFDRADKVLYESKKTPKRI